MTSNLNTRAARNRRQALRALLVASLFATGLCANGQQTWKPTRPIRIIVVPQAPGGGSDVLTRIVAERTTQRLGQAVLVENKTGASGSEFVHRAAPEGDTLLFATLDTQSVNRHIDKLRYDTTKFVPLGGIGTSTVLLIGRRDLPAANLQELPGLLKWKSLNYSTSGPGASLLVAMMAFEQAGGASKLVQIPYQGAAPAMRAVLAGEVDAMVPALVAVQHLNVAGTV